MQGGTFTLSNLGMYGVDAFTAIINPPQAAILAVGRIADRVLPLGGMAVVQPALTLTLSCDHRAVDGARAGSFLRYAGRDARGARRAGAVTAYRMLCGQAARPGNARLVAIVRLASARRGITEPGRPPRMLSKGQRETVPPREGAGFRQVDDYPGTG